MGKRRITLIEDPAARSDCRVSPSDPRWWTGVEGVTVESVVDIPDPDRVQEFRVRVVTKATENPILRGHLHASILYRDAWVDSGFVTVTEVDPT